jgi:hypothetical protein
VVEARRRGSPRKAVQRTRKSCALPYALLVDETNWSPRLAASWHVRTLGVVVQPKVHTNA